MGAWRERNFRLLFIGQTASALGNTLVPVALSFGVLDLTGSAADLGFVLGAGSATMVIFILLGGVIADRLPRRALMLFADLLRGCAQLATGILLLVGHVSIIPIIVLSAVIGIGAALFNPAATGLIPAIVKPEHIQQANALQQTANSIAGIAGPALAGILVVSVGPGWAIIGDAATFFVSVALLAALRFPQVQRAPSPGLLHEMREGWNDFWSRDWFRTIVLGASAFNFLYAGYAVLGPVMSKLHYGGAGAWAIVATCGAIGATVAGLLVLKIRPKHPLRIGTIALGLACLAPLALAAVLPLWAIAIASALVGGSLMFFNTLWDTSVQRHIPEHLISRASSYDHFGSLVTFPIGLAVAGPLAVVVGPQPILLGIGVLVLLVVGLSLLVPSVRNQTNDLPEATADA
jgi:MFS family permease